MREAVGGTLLTYIIIPIIILFIIFVAFIMNYASAYRTANYLITQVESCNADMVNCGKDLDMIKEEAKQKYKYIGDIDYGCYENAKGSVYAACVYVSFDLPFFKNAPLFRIKSETKTIYNVECSKTVFNNGKCK